MRKSMSVRVETISELTSFEWFPQSHLPVRLCPTCCAMRISTVPPRRGGLLLALIFGCPPAPLIQTKLIAASGTLVRAKGLHLEASVGPTTRRRCF